MIGIFLTAALTAQAETELRKVGKFSTVKASGVIEVILTESDRFQVVAEASSRHLADIQTTVSDGVLHIKLRDNHDKNIEGPLKVHVKAPKLERIYASGAVSVHATNTLRMRDLYLDLSGATHFTADLRIESLKANLSGASKLNVSGNAESYQFDMSGAANVNAFDLPVLSGVVNMSGASHAELHVHQDLSVKASGASSLVYDGDPQVDESMSGMSSISKK